MVDLIPLKLYLLAEDFGAAMAQQLKLLNKKSFNEIALVG